MLNFKVANFKKSGIEENSELKKIFRKNEFWWRNYKFFKVLEELSTEVLEIVWKFCCKFNFFKQNIILHIDLEDKEELSLKKPNNADETNKYHQKKLSKYHLKIVESALFFIKF